MKRATVLILFLQAVASAQTEAVSHPDSRSGKQAIIYLQGVSIYSGYYTSGSPASFEIPIQSLFAGPTSVVGAVATVGGTRSGERATFSWRYSPSYFNVLYSEQNRTHNDSLNHRAGITWNRKLWKRWALTTSLNGLTANLEQLYFSPGVLSSVAELPTSFDELTAGILTGKFTDMQLAALLTGAQLQTSPEQAYLYGARMLNATVAIGLSWAKSERTSVSMTVAGNRSQHMNGTASRAETSTSSLGPLLPQMTTAGATIGWSYSLSPRTQIALDASSIRTFSRLQQGYTESASFSIGRTMSRRWFVQGKGGAGALTYSRQVYAQPRAVQYLYGGSIGFKTGTHTFLATYERTLGDRYALGSDSTGNAIGAWHWARPGSSLSIAASGGYQELNNRSFHNTRSWRASADVARSFGTHVSLAAQYIYFALPASLHVAGLMSAENGVMVALTWSPTGR